MVRKSEKSFFGKIMGGEEETQTVATAPYEAELEVDEEEVEDVEELGAPEYEEVEEDEEFEAEEAGEEDEEPQPTKKNQMVKNRDEDWLADYEGQLNIDMFQTKDNVIIKSTIAGVRPEDIDITVANDMVSIKGTRHKEETISNDDYFYQECYWGSFSRSVIVPVDVESESIEADLKDGILTIIIPKAAKAKTRKVKVRSS